MNNNSTSARKWTVMVYMAGDNDLNDEMLWAITEMRRADVGPNKEVSVVALYDPGRGIPPQIYVINEKRENGTKGDLLRHSLIDEAREVRFNGKKLSRIYLGRPVTLRNFVQGTMKEFPADHFMLVLSGHSSNSHDDFFLTDRTGNPLTIRELKNKQGDKFLDALSRIKNQNGGKSKNIDILGLDSCQLSTTELYYQVRSIFDFTVGAEGFEPSSGWPYYEILRGLVEDPGMSGKQFARHIVETHTLFYGNYAVAGHSVDLAACRVGKGRALREAIKQLAQALLEGLQSQPICDLILVAHWRAQTYKSDQYVDLWDFCNELIKKCEQEGYAELLPTDLKEKVVDACARTCRAIKKAIVVKSCYSGPAFQHSHGLSIYFPWAYITSRYMNLDLSIATGWHRFLAAFVAKTRREPRGELMSKNGLNLIEKGVFRPSHLTRPEEDAGLNGNSAIGDFKTGVPETKASLFTAVERVLAHRNVVGRDVRTGVPETKGRIFGYTRSMKNPPIDWRPCED